MRGRGGAATLPCQSGGTQKCGEVRLRRYAAAKKKKRPLLPSGCRERPRLRRRAADVDSKAGSWKNSCQRREMKVFGGREAGEKRLTVFD